MTDDLANRFSYHPPKDDFARNSHEQVRSELLNLVERIAAFIPEGRESALFVTKMEEAMFWANAAIARNS